MAVYLIPPGATICKWTYTSTYDCVTGWGTPVGVKSFTPCTSCASDVQDWTIASSTPPCTAVKIVCNPACDPVCCPDPPSEAAPTLTPPGTCCGDTSKCTYYWTATWDCSSRVWVVSGPTFYGCVTAASLPGIVPAHVGEWLFDVDTLLGPDDCSAVYYGQYDGCASDPECPSEPSIPELDSDGFPVLDSDNNPVYGNTPAAPTTDPDLACCYDDCYIDYEVVYCSGQWGSPTVYDVGCTPTCVADTDWVTDPLNPCRRTWRKCSGICNVFSVCEDAQEDALRPCPPTDTPVDCSPTGCCACSITTDANVAAIYVTLSQCGENADVECWGNAGNPTITLDVSADLDCIATEYGLDPLNLEIVVYKQDDCTGVPTEHNGGTPLSVDLGTLSLCYGDVFTYNYCFTICIRDTTTSTTYCCIERRYYGTITNITDPTPIDIQLPLVDCVGCFEGYTSTGCQIDFPSGTQFYINGILMPSSCVDLTSGPWPCSGGTLNLEVVIPDGVEVSELNPCCQENGCVVLTGPATLTGTATMGSCCCSDMAGSEYSSFISYTCDSTPMDCPTLDEQSAFAGWTCT